MKQELRCHAVLCPKEEKARQMASCLQDRLHQALVDFKKEKVSRQNARLSLANCLQDNPSMPYRKVLLQTGTCNYKPPIERSKSAPKLTSIVEADLEEEEEWSEALPRVAEEEEEEAVVVHCTPASPVEQRVPRLPTTSPPAFATSDAIIIFGEQSSDEEDEVKDYIGEGEADSAASVSPGSQGREERRREGALGECASLSDQEELAATMGKARVAAEDSISDESGYSEDPGTLGKEVTVVQVTVAGETPAGGVEFQVAGREVEEAEGRHKLQIRLAGGEEQVTITGRGGVRWSQPLSVETAGGFSGASSREVSPSPLSLSPPSEAPSSPRTLSPVPSSSPHRSPSPSPREQVSTSPRVTDLSVKSVLLSEFSTPDKMRYIERSGLKATKSSMVLNRQEFCINI